MQSFLVSSAASPQQKYSQNPQLSTTLFEHNKKSPTRFRQSAPKQLTSFYTYSHSCSHDNHRNNNLTFKPIIHEIPFDMYPNNRGKISKSREQVREGLIEDGTKKTQERYWMKVEKQLDQTKLCTFSPQIFQSRIAGYGEEIFEKLYKQAQQIEQTKRERERQKLQKQAAEIKKLLCYKLYHKDHTQILNTQKHNLNRIQDRLHELLTKKLQDRKLLQQRYDKENSLIFQPHISNKTSELANKRIEKEELKRNVVHRLMQEVKKRNQRKLQIQNQAIQKQMKECTFMPEVNPYVGVCQVSRQSRRTQRLVSEQDDLHPFQPKIDRLSDLIVFHTRGEEDIQTKINRLSIQPLLKKSKNLQKLNHKFYSEFTFKPILNSISTCTNPRTRVHTCQQPPPEIYSFKPFINQNSRVLRPYSTQSARLRTQKKQVQYQMQAEYNQLKECSFQPRINSKRHEGGRKGLDEVEGMDKFLRWRELAKKKEEESKAREKDVFGWALKYDVRVKNQCRLVL